MCYFALSPEDEAKDAADHIYSQNKIKPLLLVPQNDLGKRVAQSFAVQWSQLSANSSQAYVQYFGNTQTLSANMNRNIGISLAGNPILIDETLSGGMVSAGFDAIYVYSSYDELTLIKPMLDMGANKTIGNSSAVTLYSSSKSHVANASNDFNYDMNKTEYADIPMVINQMDKVNTNIPSNIQKDYSLIRLYAMGIDAWRLTNRFNQLNSYQPNFLDGMTGKLSTSDQCEVTRALSWQQYIYGEDKSDSKSE
ncbi:MAG: penicillin-binding protein activator [Gilliamella sp.]|nr:penicillin-binding protein activator [Gilliamella sp.]